MRSSTLLRIAGIFLIVLTAINAASAFAAANSIPASRLDYESSSITADHLKPSECSGITIINLIAGGGNVNGTNENDLILGSTGADNMRGQGGDDCIVGGDGDDRLSGGGGADVILGGGGDDTLLGGQGDDYLYGGPDFDDCDGGAGTDSADSCETTKNIP